MNKQQKVEVVESLRSELSDASAVVLTEMHGVDVPSVVQLRRRLREENVQYRVVKNTLIRLAIAETDKEPLREYLHGPTAIAWSHDDPVAAARILHEFGKDHEGLKIKAGLLDGKLLDVDGVVALAKLPNKQELRAQFLSVLQAPAQKLVRVLVAAQRNLLSVLAQRRDQLEQGSEQSGS